VGAAGHVLLHPRHVHAGWGEVRPASLAATLPDFAVLKLCWVQLTAHPSLRSVWLMYR